MVLLRLDFSVQSWTSIISVCPLQLGIFPGSVILGLLKFAGYIIPKDLWLPGREHHALVCPMKPTSCPMHRDPEIIPEVQTVRLTSSVDSKNHTEGIKAITSQRKTEFSAGEEFPPRMMSRKLHVYFALDHDEAKPLDLCDSLWYPKALTKKPQEMLWREGLLPRQKGKHRDWETPCKEPGPCKTQLGLLGWAMLSQGAELDASGAWRKFLHHRNSAPSHGKAARDNAGLWFSGISHAGPAQGLGKGLEQIQRDLDFIVWESGGEISVSSFMLLNWSPALPRSWIVPSWLCQLLTGTAAQPGRESLPLPT